PVMTGAPAGMTMPPAQPMAMPNMASVASTPVPIPIQAQPGQMSGDDQVYTMPDKFLQQTPAAGSGTPKKAHKGLTIILIIIIVLAVLGIIGGVIFYIFKVLPSQNQPSDTGVVVENQTNTTNANETTNTNNSNTTNVNTTNSVNDNANTNVLTNANANDNTNENVNANVNSNANTNSNVNENGNTNSNTNVANTNSITNATNSTNTTVLPSSKDTDLDALTNEEEKIWGTKADLPDTDSDGYTDGAELAAGYDPLNSISSGRLIDSGALGTYANKDYGYTVSYPVDWLAEALSEGATNEIMFTPDVLDTAGQFVEVIVENNSAGLTAMDWYIDQANVDEASLQTVTTSSGLEGVWSLDGNTAYFTTNNNVYAVSYRYGISPELYFKTTFTMMVKSFTLTKKVQNANDAVTDETTPTTDANTNTTNENTNTNTNTANTNTN
ncbi:MAG: hypothetical protein ACD_43C00067G0004, partial [uncultured bacterium]